jgi:hypothetical protein
MEPQLPAPNFDHNLSHLNPVYTDHLCFVKFSTLLPPVPVPGCVTPKSPAGYYEMRHMLPGKLFLSLTLLLLNCI